MGGLLRSGSARTGVVKSMTCPATYPIGQLTVSTSETLASAGYSESTVPLVDLTTKLIAVALLVSVVAVAAVVALAVTVAVVVSASSARTAAPLVRLPPPPPP